MIKSQNASTPIEIDGGVTLANARLLIDAGAHALVAGNTVFNSPNPTDTIHQLKRSLT
jgi:ribulose-phosphate 3-epimerase